MFSIYVPAFSWDYVISAIEEGEWYYSEMTARAVADQFSDKVKYKVYRLTIEEMDEHSI